MFVRRLVFALGVLSVGSVGAMAADMPLKAPLAPAVIPFSWTGFYVGIHAGGSRSADNDPDYTLSDPTGGAPLTSRAFTFCGTPTGAPVPVPTSPNPFDLQTSCSSGSSFLGGGQIGYNWQTGSVVFGAELDGSWRELIDRRFGVFGNNTTAGVPFGSVAGDTAYFKSKQGAVGTLRGRIGYAPGNWLLYVTGGLAVGHVEHSVTEVLAPGRTCITPGGTTCRSISDSDTRIGWTVGAGLEVAFWKNWSIGLEYLYVDLGNTTLTLNPLGPASGTQFFFNTSSTTFHDTSHIARLKLNYRFAP